MTIVAFLLSREWRDRDDGIEIVLWGRAKEGVVRARIAKQDAVMFVPRGASARADRRAERPLATMYGDPVDTLYFRSQRALVEERARLRGAGTATFEADVKPSDRFLMERFITASMRIEGTARVQRGVTYVDAARVKAADFRTELSLLALDLEVQDAASEIMSAAVATRDRELVIVRGRGAPRVGLEFVPDERALLKRFFAEIHALDPDVICGWNVVEFDLAVLEARCRANGMPFALGRAGEWARVLPGSTPQQRSVARVPGRVVLDGIATLKSATWSFERYTLEYVAQRLLGRGKHIAKTGDPIAEIRRMHAEDPHALAEYNLEDCRLVLDIFAKTDLLAFAMERSRLTGLPMDRHGGSVAAFDHLYLPKLHRRGFVAPDVESEVEVTPSPGGHVLDSIPGLYRDVLSFDFRSLYPSIIRTFAIDPLRLQQPGSEPILPDLIATLHEARAAAKEPAMSRAIKILMNSFYGVLGTPGCRFFDARLPTAITTRGHAVIERARAFFLERGMPVIYGDTDSLFVHVEDGPDEATCAARGKELAATLTGTLAEEIEREHGKRSHLELRFESHYLRFLMPTTRGADRGSKKRYAGLVRKTDGATHVVVRGLEAVRRDWSPLARRTQVELLRRVFHDEPYAEWLVSLTRDLGAGRLDEELVYHRRKRGEGVDAWVMTVRGPEPEGARTSAIDHGHYLDKQLAPACDVVLHLLNTSFDEVAGSQRRLFGE